VGVLDGRLHGLPALGICSDGYGVETAGFPFWGVCADGDSVGTESPINEW
jgi:hypothetical protein